jgi:MYXO-CTERM domain-containing protein
MSQRSLCLRSCVVALCALPVFGCALDAPTPERASAPRAVAEQEVHAHGFATHRLLEQGIPHAALHAGARHFSLIPEQPVWQVGLLLDGEPDMSEPPVMWRARGVDGIWTGWHTAEITWQEERLSVGRIALAEPGTDIEIRLSSELSGATVELFEELRARRETLARALPFASDALLTRTQALAPADLVIPRADWGARNPDQICGSVVTPYRVSVHHTVQPDADDGDAPARMRQMQAYHMDSNGWCDIGYHFVVAQSGKIYQGRADERRPGAHVGNQNAGNIGVSFIGNYQRDQPPQVQLDAGKEILSWIRTTYDIQWDTEFVKGHRQWPGQSTSCPGDNLLAKLPELMDVTPVEPAPADIGVEVNWLAESELTDLLMQGTSSGILDVLPGDTMTAELLITNRSPEPIRGVELAYTIEEPFIRATGYTVQTDAPAMDRATWMLNDADSAPENPPRDEVGASGTFTLYAMAAGETKRVRVDFEAARYSLGASDHPDVRAWVKQIDGLYVEQTAWDQPPALQETAALLQAEGSLDVISGVQWQFDAGEPESTEGWQSCAKDLLVDVDTGTLPLPSRAGCMVSPAWTAIDAGTWDHLVLRMTRNDEPATLQISWGEGAEGLSDTQRLFVEVPAQDSPRLMVIPMGEAPAWKGDVGALELRTLGAQSAGTLAIDALYFQSSASQTTSADPDESFAEIPLTLISLSPPDMSGSNPADPDVPAMPDPKPGADPGEPEPKDPEPMMAEPGERDVSVNDGCAMASPSTPTSPIGVLALVLGGVLWRRRRS